MDHNPGAHRAHLTQNQSGNVNQRWSFRDAGNGWYWLVSATDGGCLTANNAGEQLGVWRCDGSDMQRWRLDNVQTGPTPGAGAGGGGNGGGGNTGGGGGGGGNTGGGWDGGLGGGGSGGGNNSEPGGCAFQEPGAEHRGSWMWKNWSICRGTEISDSDSEQSTALRMRDDGTLELVYGWAGNLGRWNWAVTWTAPGSAGCGRVATMQTDGNFVVYGDGNRVCWSSGTSGSNAAWLEINRSGTLTIWWIPNDQFQAALAEARRPGGNILTSSLEIVITLIQMVPHRKWGVGSQHRISTPNCGKIHCT